MSMLLSLQDNEVFNKVMDLDTKHNNLAKVMTTMVVQHRARGEQFKSDSAYEYIFSGNADSATYLALMPRMTEVNDLIRIIVLD